MLAQELIVIEVALNELALVPARLLLGLGKIGTANAELCEHDERRLGIVVLAVQLPASLDHRGPHLPGPVREHHHVGANPGCRIDRVLAGSHGVDAPIEGISGSRPDLDARLLVILAVSLDEARLERVHDHRRCLVEATPRLVHA